MNYNSRGLKAAHKAVSIITIVATIALYANIPAYIAYADDIAPADPNVTAPQAPAPDASQTQNPAPLIPAAPQTLAPTPAPAPTILPVTNTVPQQITAEDPAPSPDIIVDAPTITMTSSITGNGPLGWDPISGISVAPGSIPSFTWTSTNADSCVANSDWSGTQPLSGSFNSNPLMSGDVNFHLVCTGAGGTTDAHLTYEADMSLSPAVAPTLTFTIDQPDTFNQNQTDDQHHDTYVLDAGTTTVVTWSSTGADTCVTPPPQPYLDWNESGLSGTYPVTMNSSYTYGLTCTSNSTGLATTSYITLEKAGDSGSSTSTVTPKLLFWTDATSTYSQYQSDQQGYQTYVIPAGTDVTVFWSSQDADGCSVPSVPPEKNVDWSESGLSGAHPLTMTGSVTFGLTCTNTFSNTATTSYITLEVDGDTSVGSTTPCTVASTTIVSDTSVMTGDETNAVAVSFIHPYWTTIPGATWIWGTDPTENPDQDTTFTFTKTFTLSTTSPATFEIAADNTFSASINDHVIDTQTGADNFSAVHTYTIDPSWLIEGSNTLSITVTNTGAPGQTDPQRNPGGLTFKLTVGGCGTTDTNNGGGETSPALNVITLVNNDNNGTSTPADFTITVDGTNVSSTTFAGTSTGMALTLDAGTFNVTGSTDAGYTLSTSTDCSGSIANGDNLTCTLTYDDIGSTVTGGGGGGTPPPSGGGGGGSSFGGGGSGGFVPLALNAPILGANSTCPLLTSFLRLGANNPTDQVIKLQAFLTSQGFPVASTGTFDTATEAAVKAFQVKYLGEVMGPWKASQGSGIVYITTKKKVNEIACAEPFVLTGPELDTINAYLQSQGGTQNGSTAGVTTVSSTTPGTTDNGTGSTTEPIIGQNGLSNPNVAAVGGSSVLSRFWGFLKNLF